MGKFYLPKGSNGIYDPKSSTLVVNTGDRLLIGFSPATKSEQTAANVSLSDMSALLAVYATSGLKREYEIDTSSSGQYQLTATHSATGKALTKALTIRVCFRDYSQVAPQGQWKDPTACWMACVSWWQGCLAVFGDRAPTLVQFNTLLMRFGQGAFKNGTVNGPVFRRAVQRNQAALRMRTEMINPTTLVNFMGRWPLIVAFGTPGDTGHMNVLHAYNEAKGNVVAMEPWYPDTPTDGWNTSTPYIIDPDFVFKGKHVTRPLTYYTRPAPGLSQLLVGYPEEYVKYQL